MRGMIKDREIVVSDSFVREPVDKICDKINNSPSKKIILTGGRGIGKSIILKNSERRGLSSENQHMAIRFDPAGIGTNFGEDFYEHYYELLFADALLSYIKTYCGIIYNTKIYKMSY